MLAPVLERLLHDVVVAPFLAALAELPPLLEVPLQEYPLLQFHPLRHPALPIRVVHALLGRLRDVGSQLAQGLLAALDRVALLDRLVAQLPGEEHCAHLDPGCRMP
jgi:hypothetical protein